MCIICNHEKTTLQTQDFLGEDFIFGIVYSVWGKFVWEKSQTIFQGQILFGIGSFFSWGKFEMFIFRANFIFERLVWSILCLGNLKSLFGVKFICLRASLKYMGHFLN